MRLSTILFLGVLIALLCLTLFFGGLAYISLTEKKAAAIEVETSIPVHVTRIETGTVEDIVYVTGYVEPADRVDVIAKIPMPGKLIEAKVKEGDEVSRNQVLATVDRDEVGAVYLAYGVKAPMSGIVAKITSDPGALISAQSPVAVIVNIDKVKIKTSIIEADMGRIRKGTPARVMVDAWPGRTFDGTVTRIEPVLDAYSHTAPLEITIQNGDHDLKPGMFSRVELISDVHSGVPVVPKEVVLKREGKDLAYVVMPVEEKGKTVLRIYLNELKLGYYDLKNFEVKEGAKLGDLVVDRDLVVLKDQTMVSVENPPEGWVDPGTGRSQPAANAPGATAGDTATPAPQSP